MPYEIRLDSQRAIIVESAEAALAAVRAIIKADPDADPDILDTETGRAFEPAASRRWRDELAQKIGY